MKQNSLKKNEIIKKRRSYKINPSFFILRDEKSVSYHVKQHDYFGTLATIISLLMQNLKSDNDFIKNRKLMIKTLKNLEKDLNFLQAKYNISLKAKLDKPKNKKQKNNTKRQANKPMLK